MALLEIVQVRQGWAGQELTPPAPSARAPWAQPASMMSSGSVWMGNSQGSSGSFGTKEVTIEPSARLRSEERRVRERVGIAVVRGELERKKEAVEIWSEKEWAA